MIDDRAARLAAAAEGALCSGGDEADARAAALRGAFDVPSWRECRFLPMPAAKKLTPPPLSAPPKPIKFFGSKTRRMS